MLVQCDFDGTIIRNNLSILLREQFARGDWRKIEDAYFRGHVTVEESNRQQYRLIRESADSLLEFIRQHIDVRPGFTDLIDYCDRSGIGFVIVSSGVDFYINPVLDSIGMSHLELHCARSVIGEDGIDVYYLDPEGKILDSSFKDNCLTWLRQRDNTIIYLGDGYSDLGPARLADHVFATGTLRELLKKESIPAIPFDDFREVIRGVQSLS